MPEPTIQEREQRIEAARTALGQALARTRPATPEYIRRLRERLRRAEEQGSTVPSSGNYSCEN